MSLRLAIRNYKETLAVSAQDLGAPGARWRAWLHYLIFDHALIRMVWTNMFQIAPGVYRGNQPTPARLRRLKARGFRSIINLRGATPTPNFAFQKAACDELGLTLYNIEEFSARHAPEDCVLLDMIAAMRAAEKPVLIHCKSGADRTSLAAAVYLLAIEGESFAKARRQFWPLYIHFKWTATGVMDHIIGRYEAAHDETGISLEDWLRSDYHEKTMQRSFEATRKQR